MADNNYYLCPAPYNPTTGVPASADAQFGWSKEFLQQARSYLKLQPAYPYIQDSLDLINGDTHKTSIATLSNAKPDLVVRNLRELNAAQSNLRIIPAIQSFVPQIKAQTILLNLVMTFWQQKTFSDRVVRQAWQNETALGTGYCSIGY